MGYPNFEQLRSESSYQGAVSNEHQRTVNYLAKKHWDWVDRMGWHNSTVLEKLALVASEVGEAVNECRGEQPTSNFKYELADIVLRAMDIAHDQHIDLEAAILEKMDKNAKRGSAGRLK